VRLVDMRWVRPICDGSARVSRASMCQVRTAITKLHLRTQQTGDPPHSSLQLAEPKSVLMPPRPTVGLTVY
jgi:hypothetical protein